MLIPDPVESKSGELFLPFDWNMRWKTSAIKKACLISLSKIERFHSIVSTDSAGLLHAKDWALKDWYPKSEVVAEEARA